MEKLRFEFVMKAAADKKSNALMVTSITTPDGEIFDIPAELQEVSLHTELMKTDIYKKIKNTNLKRNQKRNVWILLNAELKAAPFAAPVTLAFKKEENKKSRLCIDFRDLNKMVVPQSQTFPLIEDLVIKTRNCKYFSTLDVNSAFWSIPLRVSDRYKTGFVTQEGHFQWTCLPFGLKTSPAIFQRIMSNIIRKNDLAGFTVCYIDDLLIFSKTFNEHIDHLKKLFQAIKKEGFRLKFSKCAFAKDSVKYLGHIIQNNSVKPLNDNLISIKKFPVPTTKKNVRQFLGKINFYHKYVPNIAIKLDPLHDLLRKDREFKWTEECQKSFDEMKKILCSQPVLTIFDSKLPIRIYTDASLLGLGAILKQIQENGEEKPVGYFSKKIKFSTEEKKKATFLECLAIKECLQYWQHLLLGRKFKVITDHKPLENLNIKSRTDEDLGDLTHYLSQYDIEIEYSPGKYNQEADCLKARFIHNSTKTHENNSQPIVAQAKNCTESSSYSSLSIQKINTTSAVNNDACHPYPLPAHAKACH
ncbi:unnamed protein product [Trichogramma brassicae]|uniref:Reverse transcriptase domain-containing protein n=1 Tax=Trichogramma brassicae TaxID=86971 RepID=A0A6H5HVM2_9HYME|nr:unnamed protein product [Trichogramma brassicae]